MTEEKKNYSQIEPHQFFEAHICAGTILSAKLNPKARNPAYVLTLDFGPWGIRQSSAQITQNYTPEALIGTQVLAVLNFPPRMVAAEKSEVLVLACVCEREGTILIRPHVKVENGTRVQ